MGAPRSLVFRIYLAQVLILAGLGILLGLAAGALVPPLLAPIVSAHLAVTIRTGVYLQPLALAATYGLLVALAFTLWPLSSAGGTSPAVLFRGYADVASSGPTLRARLAVVLVAAALAGLAILSSDHRRIGLGFVAGTVACFGLYRGFAWLVTRAAGLIAPRDPRLRLGLGNIRRPGSPAVSVVFSLGLGLTVLIAVALVDGNLQAEIRDQIPREAPAFFFIDVQPPDVDRLRQVALDVPGVRRVDVQPSIRGRIVRINGVPTDEVAVDPDASWAVRSDRGITFAAEQPASTRVVAGQWWPPDYDGPPVISFDAAIARGFHVGLGDTLTVNVMGREITARIVNLRDIDWLTLSINHTIIFAPGVLEHAPLSFIATAYADPGSEEGLFRAVTAALPNVSVVHIKDVLQTVSDNLANIGLAVRAVASVTLLAGLLVLAESVRADIRRRYHDAVVLKVLGATRGDILLALAAEYAYLALATAGLAALLGSAISWVFMRRVMTADWVPLPGTVALAALAGVLVTLAFGLGSVWRVLGRKAWPVLRNE
jgi:putative ABC transport system permease protein